MILDQACARGHEYTPENTYVHADGWRRCRKCNREQQNRRREADKALLMAVNRVPVKRVTLPTPTVRGDETPDAWMASALCTETDPEIFTGDQGDTTAPAKRICAKCPVIGACLQWALDHDEQFSVWGGLAPKERKALKRRQTA